jgi:hypothetical protein
MRISAAEGVLAGFLTSAIVVIVTALVEAVRHAASMKLGTWNGWSVIIISAGLAVNWLALLYVMRRVEELQRTNRIAIQYVDRKNDAGRRNLLSIVGKLEPDSDVLIVNYFNRKFGGFEAKTEAVRKLYFEALEGKLDIINYHRIIQADPEAHLRDLVDETHLAHFRTVLELRDRAETDRPIQIERSPIRYPYSFFIIKNPSGSKHLSLDIFEESPVTGQLRIVGALHVTDPDEQLIAPFEALFRNLAAASDRMNISIDQLGETNSRRGQRRNVNDKHIPGGARHGKAPTNFP